MVNYAFQLDERTKKTILVICALFILLLLITGTIYFLINRYMKRQQKKVDQYMYDLCIYKIVNNQKQFYKAVQYYETRALFNGAKWAWRCIVLFTAGVLIATWFLFDKNFEMIFTEFFKLFPHVVFQTVGQVNEALSKIEGAALISGPSWMPISILPSFISKNPNFADPALYVSSIYYVIMFVCAFKLFLSVIGYIARKHHGKKMSHEVYQKNLESMSMANNIAQTLALQNQMQSQPLVQEHEEL